MCTSSNSINNKIFIARGRHIWNEMYQASGFFLPEEMALEEKLCLLLECEML